MTKQSTTREKIGVTQQAFADFLGVSISQLAMAEIHQRILPTQVLITISQIDICLLQAPADIDGDNNIKLLDKRYKDCLLQIATAQRKLEKLRQQYQQCFNAITVAQNLPSKLPQATPEQLLWLELLANDATQKLSTCGKAQQQLLHVKIIALETEAAALLPLLSPL
jgi:transcriptional regulator with XRE-family HTH domain